MKLETFQGKPKRKYVRKVKEAESSNLNTFIINNNNNIENSNLDDSNLDDSNLDDSNIIESLDNEINQNLSNCVKKMKLNNDDDEQKAELKKEIKQLNNIQHNVEMLSTIHRSKPVYVEKVYYNPNVINVKDYEFMTPINVYLYYVSEKIGKNVIKYVIYTHIYKHMDHHILCPTVEPLEYELKECKIRSEVILLGPNVTLHVKEYIKKRGVYTYESCEKSLNRKRKKEVFENGFDYDFCQLRIEGLEYKHKNSYIFEYESKYISFVYDIYKSIYE